MTGAKQTAETAHKMATPICWSAAMLMARTAGSRDSLGHDERDIPVM